MLTPIQFQLLLSFLHAEKNVYNGISRSLDLNVSRPPEDSRRHFQSPGYAVKPRSKNICIRGSIF
jgi:hypothetical protein